MPKNVQTTAQLHSFHVSEKKCSKLSKLGFKSTWTENFQMFKLVLEKAEEPEIKLPISTGSWKKHENPIKTSTSALLTTLKPLTVWITINCGKFLKEMGTKHLTCCIRNLYADQEKTVRTGHRTMDWFQTGKGGCQGCILSPFLFNLHASWEMSGWRKHKLDSRLLGEISIKSDKQMTPPLWQSEEEPKEPRDEKERGEWKSWLKTQDSKI